MSTKIINAKCPYCKTEFITKSFGDNWAQILWGEYAPSNITKVCSKCGNKSEVSLTKIYKYSAKKMKA